MEVLGKAKAGLMSVTLEPVFFLFCVNLGLVMISNQDLYLAKACQVNLKYSLEVCNNRSAHVEVQKEVQQYVSGIQAYNGMLQSAPAVVFTIFAGPLSDTYGRKPLMIFAMFGYLVLDLVFLINSFWFHELGVEYLLFECLQDMTGGAICFYLASYSYMVDCVHPASRTWRMSVLDSFMPMGFMLGLPLGTFLKAQYGSTVLYLTGVLTVSLAMVYVALVVKDSRGARQDKKGAREDKKTAQGPAKDKLQALNKFPGFNKGVFPWVLEVILSGLRTIFRQRADGGRTWVVAFLLVFCLSKAIDSGSGTVQYMFYRLQYGIESSDMSSLMSIGGPLMLVTQLAILPLLSGVLGFRDTSILSLAVASIVVSDLLRAFNSQVWVLYATMVLGMLHNTITTTSRSNLSKLLEENEIGKAFSVLGILQALLPVVTKPAFALLYRHTLASFPAAFLLVAAFLYTGVLAILIFTHLGLKKRERSTVVREKEEEGLQLPESQHLTRGQQIEERETKDEELHTSLSEKRESLN